MHGHTHARTLTHAYAYMHMHARRYAFRLYALEHYRGAAFAVPTSGGKNSVWER